VMDARRDGAKNATKQAAMRAAAAEIL
jgi:hypothetical protein